MPQFKRSRLFTNISTLTPENIIYDEVWVYKLVTDNGARKEKYRIRYHKTDAPTELSGITEEEAEIIGQMLDQYGPAISCTLDVWKPNGWVRCLDWMGDPSLPMDLACMELNDQFKAFVTGIPCSSSFESWTPPAPPKKPKKKDVPWKKSDKINISDIDTTKRNDIPDGDPPDFDWI
tara:strand:+ start:118 stop:648 length:531 start_codon:yes stop_codon:yes gene_type:complete